MPRETYDLLPFTKALHQLFQPEQLNQWARERGRWNIHTENSGIKTNNPRVCK